MILAIDTSTGEASIALLDGTLLRAERSWTAGGNHTRHLEPALADLLATENLMVGDLGALTVAIGPGSFSGLRVGISFAKGMALALEVPLAGIATLDVIALQAAPLGFRCLAVIPAGRAQFYAAGYHSSTASSERSGEYRILGIEEVVRLALEADVLAGPGADAVERLVRERGGIVRVPPAPWRLRRAGFLAELGRQYFESGGMDQLQTLEPLYLRRSAAEEKRAEQQDNF